MTQRDALNTTILWPSSNPLGIPDLPRSDYVPGQLVAYGQHRDVQSFPQDAAVHFFLHDYRFESVWANPGRLIPYAEHGMGFLSPDFSLYTPMPPAMQLWQIYRNGWMGALMAGIAGQAAYYKTLITPIVKAANPGKEKREPPRRYGPKRPPYSSPSLTGVNTAPSNPR